MCTHYCCSVPGVFPYVPSVPLFPCPFPPSLLLLPLPLPCLCPPAPTIASPPARLAPSLTPHTGLAVIAYQYTVQLCSVVAKYIPPSSGTPPPPLPPSPRRTSTSRQVSSAGAALSAVSPPSPGTPLGTFPCGG